MTRQLVLLLAYLTGAALVLAGVALVYVPAALVAAGVGVCLGAWMAEG